MTASLAGLCQDLHAHPELAFRETRTAALVAERLEASGYETTTGVGGTGVVGVLRNGDGPTALLRADMDALPFLERTGLAYASTVRSVDADGSDAGHARVRPRSATVMRLQGIVSREVAGTDTAVVTVGAIHAGTRENIIPDSAELLLTTRTYDDGVRERVLAAIGRVVRGEAAASGAPRTPEIIEIGSFPPVVNDPEACARTRPGFDPGRVFDPPLPAPVIDPTLHVGVRALVSAAHTWLPGSL